MEMLAERKDRILGMMRNGTKKALEVHRAKQGTTNASPVVAKSEPVQQARDFVIVRTGCTYTMRATRA